MNDIVAAKDYVLVTEATSSPISLEQIKEHLKITDDDRDDYLLSLINVVADLAEQATGRDLINKTYKGFLDCFPCTNSIGIQIRKSKLQSITSIQYLVDDVLTTLDSSKYFFTETDNNFSTICLKIDETWPTDADKRKQAIIITFVAGYGEDSCDIPAGLKQAMLASVTQLYQNAGDCADESGLSSQSKMLYMPYKLSTKLVC